MKLLRAFVGRASLVTLSTSAAILACTGGSGTSNGLGGGGAGDANAFFDDFCATFGPCCAKVNKPTDGAGCRTFYAAFTSDQVYDAAKGQACLNEIHSHQNDADFCSDPTGKSPSCEGVFKKAGSSSGTKAPGETCSEDEDCASSSEGDVRCMSSYSSGGAVTKTCSVLIENGHEGDTPCVGTKDGSLTVYETSSSSSGDAGPTKAPDRGYICDVAGGSYCDSQTHVCTKIQDVGGECSDFSQYACVKTAYCDFSTKKCVARVGAGGDCSTNSQACTEDARCDFTTHKCVARAADGSPCKTADECVSERCENGACAPKSSGTSDLTLQLLCGGSTK